MAMPQDAIDTINGMGASHLWVCNETNGTTFADSALSGAKSMTFGAGVSAGGWGPVYGTRGHGGPQTQGSLWSGTSTASCSATGKTLGGLTPGWSIFAIIGRPADANFSPTAYPIYNEKSASSTDILSLSMSASNQLTFFYRDSGHSTGSVASGSSANNIGDGPIGVTVDNNGLLTFYNQGGRFGASNPATHVTTSPSTWTDTVTTNIGYDPASGGSSSRASFSWVATFPFALTDLQWLQVYRAIYPDPPGGFGWSATRSGLPFPNSEFWTTTLPDNAVIDPLSAGIMKQWGTFQQTNSVVETLGRNEPMYDRDASVAAGATNISGIHDGFMITPDQPAFMSGVQWTSVSETGDLEPQDSNHDALFGQVELTLGRVWDVFRGWTMAPANIANRYPLATPYITSQSASTASGTLAAGFYYYAISAVNAAGKESAAFFMYGGDTASGPTQLTAPGSITLRMFADASGANPPVAWRVYRRGPYVAAGGNRADYGLLTTLSSLTPFPASTSFTDDGTFGAPDTTQRPLLVATSGVLSLLAGGTAGVDNNASQNVLTLDPTSNVNSCHATYATYGLTAGMLLTINSGGGTSEKVLIASVTDATHVTLKSNLQFAHNPGETVATANINGGFGVSGLASASEMWSEGGGGSWDWYNNCAFYPALSPSGATNNGATATSRPVIAGQITLEEALNGLIPHPVNFQGGTANHDSSFLARRWPARRHDGSSGGTFVQKEGMRYRLPAGFDETTITYSTIPQVATFQRAIVVNLRDYGWVDTDSVTGGGGLSFERPIQTGRDEWGYIMGGLWPGLNTPSANQPNVLKFLQPPATSSFTANTTVNSATLSSVSAFTNLTVGQYIIGPGIPYQTTILSTNTVAGTLVMSQPATATASTVSINIGVFFQMQVLSAFRYPTKVGALGSFTATTTAGSTSLTGISVVTNVYQGVILTGPGIPHGTAVVSVSGTTAVMSQAASASGTVAITAGRRTNRTDVGAFNTPGFQQLTPY